MGGKCQELEDTSEYMGGELVVYEDEKLILVCLLARVGTLDGPRNFLV